MKRPDIHTTKRAVPMIYSYSTPEIARHNGWTKIGYTEQDVDKRLDQQGGTIDVEQVLEWKGTAIFDDGSGDTFKDHDFHGYLEKLDIDRGRKTNGEKNEWFHVDGPTGRAHFFDFKANRGILVPGQAVAYELRREQRDCVGQTMDYRKGHEGGEFLWNAKPRFGKTLSVYDFIKQTGAVSTLIVTNRPAIANSWYDDYVKFMGGEGKYRFVSQVDALIGKPYVLSREEYASLPMEQMLQMEGYIEFVSLQDLKGSKYFGGEYDKLKELHKDNQTWDLLVIDEAHEGVATYKTDVAFRQIARKFTLHLSGTPFKALAEGKFTQDAIFNWTYADEQSAKANWDEAKEEAANPYIDLPKLNLYTYQMSEIIKDELSQGVEVNGETVEFAFDLNEFFATNELGRFIYNSSVDRFLDAMASQEKFPFSTPELRDELKHTFWLLNRVDSAKALARKLREHPVFGEYEIVLAAGDGKADDMEETGRSFDKVKRAIAEHDKTITLSVGQLTTGVTIPEWTAVMMLSNVQSPSLYMQAAFRAQNPCLFRNGTECYRKENAYVFDFDPARTLIIFEQFANDLIAKTSGGQGTALDRKENVRQLLNFFPVIGEDENGEMVLLDAAQVLAIPRKIKSAEVVRRGFMSNFLFQNISNIFAAPAAVKEILEKFQPVDEGKDVQRLEKTKEDLHLNDSGEVELPEEMVIGLTPEYFGEKVYSAPEIQQEWTKELQERDKIEKTKDEIKGIIIQPIIERIHDEQILTLHDVTKRDQRTLESTWKLEVSNAVDTMVGDHISSQNMLEKHREEALEEVHGEIQRQQVNQEFDRKREEQDQAFMQRLAEKTQELIAESEKDIVRTVETTKEEKEKKSNEDWVRDHLRGFARTIPSFLMAYGNDEVCLANFDKIIPEEVFWEVTSITLEEFRFLRDGGLWHNKETGEDEKFYGHLFDEVVFNDSIREFLELKKRLSNYFDENSTEDIFDYIPPQKTNQIFTPKKVVQQMVDLLEEENPGCFDDPDKTFADLYMKSGLYITEIVKRLYQSEAMKHHYPDGGERLRHIFAKQVYGLAPTEIIYRIATNYILGFDDTASIARHNFRKLDALEYAKTGTLERKLDEIFGVEL